MKFVLVLTLLLGAAFAPPTPSDGGEDGEDSAPATDDLTVDSPANDGAVDDRSLEDESGGLERAAVFGHYAHVYGAGKEGQHRKDKDQADQEAAQAAEEAAKAWRPPPGFPPQGGFPPQEGFPPQGSFELPPGMFPGGFPPGPNQGSQGPFQPNPNRGGPRPSSKNPNRGPGPFQQNPNHPGQGGNPPQGFPSPPPGWPQDWPFPPQMPQEGTPGSDSHMVPPPPPDPSMFEDMEFMNDPRGEMPPGFPPMMDPKGGFPPMMGPPGAYPPFMAAPPLECPKVCDLTAYPDCTCLHPAAFTKDGRGNCNVGSLKPDLQVWCYVNPDKGDPRTVCPDAKKSTTKKGYYWSRFACITE